MQVGVIGALDVEQIGQVFSVVGGGGGDDDDDDHDDHDDDDAGREMRFWSDAGFEGLESAIARLLAWNDGAVDCCDFD